MPRVVTAGVPRRRPLVYHGPRGLAGPGQAARVWLTAPCRKLLLTVHLIVAVGLIGADGVLLALGIAGLAGGNPATVYPAAYLVAVAVVAPLALLTLATGLTQGLLTPWGLFRHWWVTIKLTSSAGLAGGTVAPQGRGPSTAPSASAAAARRS